MPHTPGPWEVYDDWYIRKPNHSGAHAEVKCSFSIPASAREEHRANARLIAAAPDLLDACKEARDIIKYNCAGDFPFTLEQLEAAIKKAEGG